MTAHQVVFTPSGLRGTVPTGTTVLDAARQLGVDLDSVCGGRGICGRCQVAPAMGSFPKLGITVTADHVSAPGRTESEYHGKRPLPTGHRLGCALRIEGDLVVDVPAASQLHRQVVRKEIGLGEFTFDPVVSLRYLELEEVAPSATAESVADRLRTALAVTWSHHDVAFDPVVLPGLHGAVEDGNDRVTVALRGDTIVAVWSGFVDVVVGAAVDVGSTTIAGHLCDLTTGEVLATAGRMNPQIRFGEDLMSRVSYAMMNDGGAAELTAAVRTALDELLGELLDHADQPVDRLLELVLVGNPIMHHLVLGLDPRPLGQAPFTLTTRDALDVPATALSLELPAARVHLLPCIAGHVGADTAAVILAEGPHRQDRVVLVIDVGTNAEIVVGSREHGLFAASSPTGPAFEGAQLSCGQRATTGAIERVRIDPETLEPRYRVIGVDPWSDEPGFATAVQRTGVSGVCGSGIVEVIAELFLAGVIDARGVLRRSAAERSERVVSDGRTASYVLRHAVEGSGPELRITQNDVRAIQLAKAALRAGTDLLLERAGFTAVDEVRLAGAFGAHLDPLHTMVLGMVPDLPLDAVRAVGNAAGAGAVRALLSGAQRREIADVARQVTKVETATEPRFQDLFVAALAFPHDSAATPHLARAVALPAAGPSETRTTRRRRRAPAPDAEAPT